MLLTHQAYAGHRAYLYKGYGIDKPSAAQPQCSLAEFTYELSFFFVSYISVSQVSSRLSFATEQAENHRLQLLITN